MSTSVVNWLCLRKKREEGISRMIHNCPWLFEEGVSCLISDCP